VVSDWTARAVLRYWRLCRLIERPLARIKPLSLRPSETLLAHAVVLGLGFLLVASAMSTQMTTRAVVASGSSGSILWSAPLTSAIAPELSEPNLAEKIEIGPPTPPPTPTPAPATPAPVVATAPPQLAPTPKPVVVPPPGSGGNGVAAIYAVFGNSPGLSWALRVAKCESGYNPLAVNRSSGASGLFQFMPSTWNANFPGWNIWDPYAQSRAALAFYNAGRQSAWTCK
jgi:hypothetical protein